MRSAAIPGYPAHMKNHYHEQFTWQQSRRAVWSLHLALVYLERGKVTNFFKSQLLSDVEANEPV